MHVPDPSYVAPPPVDLSDKPLYRRWGYEDYPNMIKGIVGGIAGVLLLLSPIVLAVSYSIFIEPNMSQRQDP